MESTPDKAMKFLEGRVNSMIDSGWKPIGGLSVVTAPSDYFTRIYHQAMIRT